jgi:hypothetical protein
MTAKPAMKPSGIAKPGAVSGSIRMTMPIASAATPPMPSAPKLGMKASATMNARPSRMRPTPA